MEISKLRKICQYSVPDLQRYPLLFKVIRIVSIYLTYFLIKIPISPNFITVSGIFAAFLGLICFVCNFSMLGIIFFFYCLVSDFSDGEVSRYKNTTSKEGTYLDKLHHLYSCSVFFMAVTFALFNHSENINFLLLGFVIVPFSILLPFTITYGIDVAVVTHLQYFIKGTRYRNTNENKVDNSPDFNERYEKKPSLNYFYKMIKAIMVEIVSLSRYWSFPYIFVTVGIAALVDYVGKDSSYTVSLYLFWIYALTFPIWSFAFMWRVLKNNIIENKSNELIYLIKNIKY